MEHIGNHSHTYRKIRSGLTPYKIAKLIERIKEGGRYEIDDLSHVCLSGTNICVGYIGDDAAELVYTDETDTHPLHKQLREIFSSA